MKIKRVRNLSLIVSPWILLLIITVHIFFNNPSKSAASTSGTITVSYEPEQRSTEQNLTYANQIPNNIQISTAKPAINNAQIDNDVNKQNLLDQANWKSQNVQFKLDVLDQYATDEKQKIEDWYFQNLEQLNKWANIRISELEEEKEVAYARCLEGLNNKATVKSGSATINTYGQANAYQINRNQAVVYGNTTTNACYDEISYTSVVGQPIERYQVELASIQQDRNSILTQFQYLKNLRQQYVDDLNSEVSATRKSLIAEKYSLEREAEIIQNGGPGLIEGISWMNGKAQIMMNGRLLNIGDEINGFRVHNVSKDDFKNDIVEFERNGKIFRY